MLQAAHISLKAQQGWEGRRVKKGEGEDGMMTWLCKALRGQSRQWRVWSRHRWYGCNQRWRKGERSFGCDVGVNSAAEAYVCATWTAAQPDSLSIQWIYNECSFILLFLPNLSLLIYSLYLTSLLPFLLSPPSSRCIEHYSHLTPTPTTTQHPFPPTPSVTDSCSLSSWR